ncbi:MAG: response regulator [Bacteroidetes bacterium]|nr:response regulator [Bacteroidota bacterium]
MHTAHCLLIDDDTEDQDVFDMCLKKVNPDIKFRAMNDGVQALAALNAEPGYSPDYIFLDMNMPKMNGLECLKELKKIPRLKESKIFMYSTTSEKSVVTESINLGATDFIIKPAKTAHLKDKLARIFSIVTKINQSDIK